MKSYRYLTAMPSLWLMRVACLAALGCGVLSATAQPYKDPSRPLAERGFQTDDLTRPDAMLATPKHFVAYGGAEGGRDYATVDMDMESGAYGLLPDLIRAGRVKEETINAAVRRVLTAKFHLGLFERPYVDERLAERMLHSAEIVQAARAVGSETRVTHVEGASPASDEVPGIGAAVAAAQEADVVVAVLGELATMSGEAKCRSSLDLPGVQQELLEALHATGKPIVLVLMAGRPLSAAWAAENVPAILNVWFPGTQAGPTIADVLFGDSNPYGKLPVTVPRTVGQIPIYYNHKTTSRPTLSKYEDLPNWPLYPFGFGLSYTTFEYDDLVIRESQITPEQSVEVRVRVTNTGSRPGTEVVQLYVRDLVASVTRPVRELRGFERLSLSPGQSVVASFTLRPEELGFHNQQRQWVVEPGQFEVRVGPHALEGLKAGFEVVSARQLADSSPVRSTAASENRAATAGPAVSDSGFLTPN